MLFSLFLIVVVLILLVFYFLDNSVKLDKLKDRHIFVTGGSKGIGYELAKIAVQHGAHVTIVARNIQDLDKAKLNLIKLSNSLKQNVLAYSVDVSEHVFNIEKIVAESVQNSGPIDLLACCAGTAIAKTFEDTSERDFHQMMNINYFGSVNIVKSCLPSLKKSKDGKILLFSSLGGVFGLYGYSAYAASKFAIVGFAEVLSMELNPHNISVTVSFPPDTDTPGFKLEQIDKPQITQLISEEGGLFDAKTVAEKALYDTLKGEFISTVGMNGHVLVNLCSGMMPTKSWLLRLFQIFTMGLFRIIGLHFLYSCSKTINKVHKNQTQIPKYNKEN